MNPFEMVVLIVLIVTVGRVLQVRTSRRAQALPPPPGEDVEQLTAEVARLRERVSVLERVITDKRQRLADEIEDLRN